LEEALNPPLLRVERTLAKEIVISSGLMIFQIVELLEERGKEKNERKNHVLVNVPNRFCNPSPSR
jgi:hypothetical protein